MTNHSGKTDFHNGKTDFHSGKTDFHDGKTDFHKMMVQDISTGLGIDRVPWDGFSPTGHSIRDDRRYFECVKINNTFFHYKGELP